MSPLGSGKVRFWCSASEPLVFAQRENEVRRKHEITKMKQYSSHLRYRAALRIAFESCWLMNAMSREHSWTSAKRCVPTARREENEIPLIRWPSRAASRAIPSRFSGISYLGDVPARSRELQ
jgi:hypothetical protein